MAAIPEQSNKPANENLISSAQRATEDMGLGNRLGLNSKRQPAQNKSQPSQSDTTKQLQTHLKKMGYSDDVIDKIFERESTVRTRLLTHLGAYHTQTLDAFKEFAEFVESQKNEITKVRSQSSTASKILEILFEFALNKGMEKIKKHLGDFLERINVKRYADASDIIDYIKIGISMFKAANPKVEGKNLIEKIQSIKDNFMGPGEDAFIYANNKKRKEINSKNLITKLFLIYNQKIDQKDIINPFIRGSEEDIVYICHLLDMPDISEVSLFYEIYLHLVTKFIVWLELEAHEELRRQMQTTAEGIELLYGGSNEWTRERQMIEQNAIKRARDIANKKAASRGEAGF